MQIRATQQGPLEFKPTMMSTMSQQNFQFHEKNIGQSFGSSWASSNISQSQQQQSIASFVPGQFKVSNNGTNGFGNTKNVQLPANTVGSGFLGKIYLCLLKKLGPDRLIPRVLKIIRYF